MSIYSDVYAGVLVWTKRPSLAAETNIAIAQAVRTAHRSGKFWRDLATVTLAGLPLDQIQQIDLAALVPNFRKLARVAPTGYDTEYEGIAISELFDQDKYPRTDVYYGVGNYLMVRAASPSASIDVTYYKSPIVTPIASLDSWIADRHQDLIVLWASATVLSFIGENDISGRVQALAKIELASLTADQLEIQGS